MLNHIQQIQKNKVGLSVNPSILSMWFYVLHTITSLQNQLISNLRSLLPAKTIPVEPPAIILVAAKANKTCWWASQENDLGQVMYCLFFPEKTYERITKRLEGGGWPFTLLCLVDEWKIFYNVVSEKNNIPIILKK